MVNEDEAVTVVEQYVPEAVPVLWMEPLVTSLADVV
jgi:hypothetical protein